MQQKLIWASARIFYLFMQVLAFLSGGLTIFILGPVYHRFYLTGKFRFKLLKYTYPMIWANVKIVLRWMRDPAYRDMFFISLTAPPLMAPDYSHLKINPGWKGGNKDCNGCSRCCDKIECPLLVQADKSCFVYGSFYWRYFNCGRYPSTQKQIDYYNCPKWIIHNGD